MLQYVKKYSALALFAVLVDLRWRRIDLGHVQALQRALEMNWNKSRPCRCSQNQFGTNLGNLEGVGTNKRQDLALWRGSELILGSLELLYYIIKSINAGQEILATKQFLPVLQTSFFTSHRGSQMFVEHLRGVKSLILQTTTAH